MNTKKATKLDMDDRAKIIQYFSKANNYGLGNGESALESVKIEDMFGTCWSVPCAPPALPTIITVQVTLFGLKAGNSKCALEKGNEKIRLPSQLPEAKFGFMTIN